MVLPGGGEPHAIVHRAFRLIAQCEYDFLANIDRQAAEHGTSHRLKQSESLKYELMRHDLTPPDSKGRVIQHSRS